MESLIVDILKVIAWPTVVVVSMWLLRRPLADLVPATRRVRYKDLQVEFGKDVEEVRMEAEAELPPLAARELSRPSTEDRLLLMADVSPNAAILEAWREVERASLKLLEARSTHIPSSVTARYKMIMRLLGHAGVVEPKKLKILNDLRRLRNRVAHADGVEATVDQALEFIDIALGLITYLNNIVGGESKK